MCSLRRVSVAVQASIRSSIAPARKAWWAVKFPVSASARASVLRRMLPLARSARTCGSRSPAIRDSSIARPETPRMLETVADSLIPVSSGSFSGRWASRVRSRMISVR